MRKVVWTVSTSVLGFGAALVLYGCHADPDDPAGQAEELRDPVRRENAIANISRLYTNALAKHGGDRAHGDVKGIADVTIDKLVQTYLDHPEDTQNRASIINLLYEMRDPRGLPALIEALRWRAEVNEDAAIRAAQTLKAMEIPENEKGAVIEALSEALDRVSGARGVDNRMRIEFIRALGQIGDRRATPILTKVATAQTEEQNFLINRLAAQQLGILADPAAVPAMIKGLFLFAPNNPAMRMNDVAAEALVRIGRPSYEPLLEVLRGNDEEVNSIASAYIEAVRQRDEDAARQMSVEGLRSAEATFVLGALGFPEALEPVLAETRQEDVGRRINGALAIVRLNLPPSQRSQVRDTLQRVYEAAPIEAKPQLIAAMRYTYDAELLPFLLDQVEDADLLPQIRVAAAEAYALLANGQEAAALRQLIEREPASADGGFKENFQEKAPALDAARECDQNLECWKGKLGADEVLVLRKAAYMIGRYGQGNGEMVRALTEKLGHPELEVRLAVLQALDHVATRQAGAEAINAAVQKIDDLRQMEEGRSIWNNFSREALPIQARLRQRASS